MMDCWISDECFMDEWLLSYWYISNIKKFQLWKVSKWEKKIMDIFFILTDFSFSKWELFSIHYSQQLCSAS